MGFAIPNGAYMGWWGSSYTLKGPLWARQANFGKGNCYKNNLGEILIPSILDAQGQSGLHMVFKHNPTLGQWTFTDLPGFANEHYDATFGDLNNDGIVDLVSVLGWPPTPLSSVVVWLGKDNSSGSSQSWTQPYSISLPGYTQFFAFPHDMNADGLVDLIVAGRGSDFGGKCRINVFLNQGERGYAMYGWEEKKNPFNPALFVPFPISISESHSYQSDETNTTRFPLNYDCPSYTSAFNAFDFDKDGSQDILLVTTADLKILSGTQKIKADFLKSCRL